MDPSQHISLLDFGRQIIKKLSEDPRMKDTAAPTLYHADLHKRNIFVSDEDPTIITDLIDWQSSSIGPAFEFADEMPDFAIPNPNVSVEDQPEERNDKLCKEAFDLGLWRFVPTFFAARALDDNLLRPFRYCHRTWRDGAVAFRQELIELSNGWKELGFPDSCPYSPPTSDKMIGYKEEYEDFAAVRKLKQFLVKTLNTGADGWVPTDSWEATKSAHEEAFNEMCKHMRDEKLADDQSWGEDELRKVWPFDIP